VTDNTFTPASTTVPSGTAITWTWNSTGNAHNVTFTTTPNSGDQTSGTFTRTFNTAGNFVYNCTNHPGMSGTINVQ